MSLIAAVAKSMGGYMPITSSGNFDATAVAGTSTSSTRTLTVPNGNPGNITITFVDSGTVLLAQYSKNGGAFTNFSTGDTITGWANTDTIALRATGNNAGESRTYTLKDASNNQTISTGVHTGA